MMINESYKLVFGVEQDLILVYHVCLIGAQLDMLEGREPTPKRPSLQRSSKTSAFATATPYRTLVQDLEPAEREALHSNEPRFRKWLQSRPRYRSWAVEHPAGIEEGTDFADTTGSVSHPHYLFAVGRRHARRTRNPASRKSLRAFGSEPLLLAKEILRSAEQYRSGNYWDPAVPTDFDVPVNFQPFEGQVSHRGFHLDTNISLVGLRRDELNSYLNRNKQCGDSGEVEKERDQRRLAEQAMKRKAIDDPTGQNKRRKSNEPSEEPRNNSERWTTPTDSGNSRDAQTLQWLNDAKDALENQNADPAPNPGVNPSADPAPHPGANPSADPAPNPGGNSSAESGPRTPKNRKDTKKLPRSEESESFLSWFRRVVKGVREEIDEKESPGSFGRAMTSHLKLRDKNEQSRSPCPPPRSKDGHSSQATESLEELRTLSRTPSGEPLLPLNRRAQLLHDLKVDDWDSFGVRLVSPLVPFDEGRIFETWVLIGMRLRGDHCHFHGTTTSQHCGLSVHVKPEIDDLDYWTLKHFIFLVAMYEEHIDRLMPWNRRVTPWYQCSAHVDLWSNRDALILGDQVDQDELEDLNHLADDAGISDPQTRPEQSAWFPRKHLDEKSIRKAIFGRESDDWDTLSNIVRSFHADRRDRGKAPENDHAISLSRFLNEGKHPQTIEFRQHEGVMRGDMIRWWSSFCAALVRLANAQAYIGEGEPNEEGIDYWFQEEDNEDDICIWDLFEEMEFPTEGVEYFKRRAAYYAPRAPQDAPREGQADLRVPPPPLTPQPKHGPRAIIPTPMPYGALGPSNPYYRATFGEKGYSLPAVKGFDRHIDRDW